MLGEEESDTEATTAAPSSTGNTNNNMTAKNNQEKEGENVNNRKNNHRSGKAAAPKSPAANSPYRGAPKHIIPPSLGLCQAVGPLASVGSPPRNTKRMKNGHRAYICNHANMDELVEFPASYFADALMKKKKNYPTHCAGCGKGFFVGRGKAPLGRVKVDNNNPVSCCQNAMNHRDHKCTHAKCHGCKAVALTKQTGRPTRKREQRTIVSPGEAVEKDAKGNNVTVPAGNKRGRGSTTTSNKKGASNKRGVASQANVSRKKRGKRN